MKNHLLIILVCLSSLAFSQAYPKKALGSFIYNGVAYNYEFKSSSYDNYSLRITTAHQTPSQQPVETDNSSIPASLQGENTTTAENQEDEGNEDTSGESEEEQDYIFSEFDQNVFQTIFKKQMVFKHEQDSTNQKLHDKSVELFFKVKAQFDFLDDEPVTAYMILRRDYVYSILKKNSSVYYTGALSSLIAGHRVESVRIETEDGAIKNIIAHFVAPSTKIENVSPRTYVEFKNTFPVSISGKFDPDYFANINLYCFNCYGIKGLDRSVKLSDLLAMDIVLQNDKEDYSPVNSTIELNPAHTIVELKKEKRSKIIEIAAFSDFVGLDHEQPNGLLQIEAKRRINIRTKSRQINRIETVDEVANQLNLSGLREQWRKRDGKKITYSVYRKQQENEIPVKSSKNIKVRGDSIVTDKNDPTNKIVYKVYHLTWRDQKFRSSYLTLCNYIEPRLLFSKLEENNRLIDSEGLEDNKINPLQLVQYQLVSFGATLNLVKFSFPQLKFSWNFLSAGAYWFRSRVGTPDDPEAPTVPLNSSYALLTTEFLFRPDSRWGATFGMSYLHPSLWNIEYELTNNHGLFQPSFESFLKTNENDKLFFRVRWTYEHKERDNNFSQVQLGYSANLFAHGKQGMTTP